jgi:hypothetical protein
MQTPGTQVTQLLNSASQIAQRQPEAISLLNQVYRELFNQTIQQGCGNCYQKAFYRIQKYLYLQQQNQPLNNMTLTKREYLLKPGRSLQTTFGGDTLTNDNLTDEAAKKLLKTYPALIQHFERYPSGEVAGTKVIAPADAPAASAIASDSAATAQKQSNKAILQIAKDDMIENN